MLPLKNISRSYFTPGVSRVSTPLGLNKVNLPIQKIGLDKITSLSNLPIHQISDATSNGIAKKLLVGIKNFIDFESPLINENGSVRSSVAIALSAGAVSAFALSTILGISPIITFGAGSLAYIAANYATKHPALLDTIKRIPGPLIAMAAAFCVRDIASYFNLGWLPAFGLGYGTLIGIYGLRGYIKGHYENERLKILYKGYEEKRGLYFELIRGLEDIKSKNGSKGDILRKLLEIINKIGTSSSLSDLKNRLITYGKQINSSKINLQELILKIKVDLEEEIREEQEFKRPDQVLIAEAKIARILSWLYLVPLTICFLSKGLDIFGYFDYTLLWIAQIYNTFGLLNYSRALENQELVEVIRFPKLKEKDERSTLSTIRYSILGHGREGKIAPFLNQDHLNRIRYGPYFVTLNNDSPTIYWPETFGSYKGVNRTVAKTHVIKEGILSKIEGLSKLTDDEKWFIAAYLSMRELKVTAMSIIDMACNKPYRDPPPDGSLIRFRDSLGDGGGEKVCASLFYHILREQTKAGAFGSLTKADLNKLMGKIKNFIVKKNGWILEDVFNSIEVRRLCERIGTDSKLDDKKIADLFKLIEAKKEAGLLNVLLHYTKRAGISDLKAMIISKEIVRGLKNNRIFSEIADLGERVILKISSKEDENKLAYLLAGQFNINIKEAETIINQIKTMNIDEAAKTLNEEYKIEDNLFYRIQNFAKFNLLSEVRGEKSEEGNIIESWNYVKDKDESNLSPGQRQFKSFIMRMASNDKVEANNWINTFKIVEILKEKEKEKNNSDQALLFSMRIEAELNLRGLKLKPSNFDTAMSLGKEIAEAAAKIQPWSIDYAEKAKNASSKEAAEYEVWEDFIKKLEEKVKNIVEEELEGYDREIINETFYATWRGVLAELEEGRNELERTTLGLTELMIHELMGVREIGEKMSKDANIKKKLKLIAEDINVEDIKQKRKETLENLNALLAEEEKKILLDDLEILFKSGLGVMYFKNGRWNGGMRNIKGWPPKTFEMLEKEIPEVLLGNDDLKIVFEKTPYIIAEKRTYLKDKTPEEKERLKEVLRNLVEVESSSYKLSKRLRELVISQEADEMINKKLVEEDTAMQIAEFIVKNILESEPKEVLNIKALLDKHAPEIVDEILRFSMPEGIVLSKNSGNRLLKERLEILAELNKQIKEGKIGLYDEETGKRLKESFKSPFLWSRLSMLSEVKRGKDANTNHEFNGSRIYTQIGVLSRYMIDLYRAERLGFFRIPINVSQTIKINVVDQIRLSVDETEDAKLKLERGMLQDDIARRLIHKIYNEGKTSKKAAEEVWKEIEPKGEERKITEAYYRIKNINDIKTNLEDIANEIGILIYASGIAPIVAGLHKYKQNKEIMLKLLKGKKDISDYINSLNNLDQKQKDTLKEIAEDTERNLQRDSKIPWYTLGARWREGGIRGEFIIPRPRTFEEIATWLNSIQEVPERSIEEGELLENGLMLRKIAKIADENILADSNKKQNVKYLLFKDFSKKMQEDHLTSKTETFEKLKAILDEKERKGVDIVNCLDERRFTSPKMVQVGTHIQMNADTDNFFYPELLEAASYFGYHHGILTNGNEVVQFGLNYIIPYKSKHVRMQRDRDLGGPQRVDDAKSAGAPFGAVRRRREREENVKTLTGYANLFPMQVGWQATTHVEETNVANTSYQIEGTKLFKYVLNSNSPYKSAKIFNKFVKWLGWGDGLDFYQGAEYLSRFIPAVSIIYGAASFTLNAALTYAGVSSFPTYFGYFFLGSLIPPAFFHLYPRVIDKGSLKLNQFFSARRLYPIDPSEDLALTRWLKTKGFKVRGGKGLRQENDAMKNIAADQAQKLRWQAQNAANAIGTIKDLWNPKYRKATNLKERSDLLAGPIYNNFGLSTTIYRLSLLGFIFLGLPSMLLLDSNIFSLAIENNLALLVELGLLNYGLIWLLIRKSTKNSGTSKWGSEWNFAYDEMMTTFNIQNVRRRLWSGSKASFNPSIILPVPSKIKTFGKEGASLYMRKNWDYIALFSYALYKIVRTVIEDGWILSDFMSLGMASLIFWVGRSLTYLTMGQLGLNSGITSLHDAEEWRKKHAAENEKGGKQHVSN